MAEAALGLGSSILALASFGVTVVKTLRSFIGSYTGAESRVQVLFDDLSITVWILDIIGITVKEYEVQFQITASVFEAKSRTCENNSVGLEKALKKSRGDDEKRSRLSQDAGGLREELGALGTKGKHGKIGCWDKLMFALGGEDEMKELLVSVETARSNLLLLLDLLQLFILKEQSKRAKLSDDQAEDLTILKKQSKVLFRAVKKASSMQDGVHSQYVESAEARKSDNDCGNFNAIAKRGEIDGIKDEEARQISDSREEPIRGRLPSSPFPHGASSPSPAHSRRNHRPKHPADARSIYEGWIVEREVRHESPRRFLSFCGLEIKSPLVFKWLDYNYSPFSQDKAQLRKYMYEGDVESTRLKQDVFGNVFMPKLPPGALREVQYLLRIRNSTTQPYRWRIVAISDKIQSQKQWRFEKLLKKPVKWLVVMRGGLMQDSEGKAVELPCLYTNPWTMERPDPSTRGFEHARSWSPTTHQSRPEQHFYHRRRREMCCHCLGEDKQRYRSEIEDQYRGHDTLQEHSPICSKGRDQEPERELGEDEAKLLLDKYLENFMRNE